MKLTSVDMEVVLQELFNQAKVNTTFQEILVNKFATIPLIWVPPLRAYPTTEVDQLVFQ